MQEIMMREESKLDFDRHKAHPVPTSILVGEDIPFSSSLILTFDRIVIATPIGRTPSIIAQCQLIPIKIQVLIQNWNP